MVETGREGVTTLVRPPPPHTKTCTSTAKSLQMSKGLSIKIMRFPPARMALFTNTSARPNFNM